MPQNQDANQAHALHRASCELLVMSALADGKRYGYVIQKRIEQTTGFRTPPGTLYPLLKRLQEAGHITCEQDNHGRKRAWYRLTQTGQAHYMKQAANWQATVARLQGLVLPALRHIKNHPTTPPPEVPTRSNREAGA